MNCVEFRRELGIDPHSRAEDFLRHRAECARCAAAAERACAHERGLARALAIDVPSELADRLLLAQATADLHHRTRWRRLTGLALAATLVLAIGIVGLRAEATPLSAQAIAHVEHEPKALQLTQPLPAAMTRAAFRNFGVELRDVPEGVSFVYCCPMNKRRTVHLVMLNGDDPVSVIWLSDDARARTDFQRDGWQGRLAPLGSGTLILLAKNPRAFDRVEAQWRAAFATKA